MTGLEPGAATMTVLFTDLVDSTAMRSRLGDDRADAVRREHDDLLARHVADHRGTVVKGLGDGIMAVFRAPSEALASVVAIEQAIVRRNRHAPVSLSLRMGLSVGEVRVEGDDVFGTPVVEAARLCARADDDQVLASEWVKALAGSRSPVPFEEVGHLQLKGLTAELFTYEVRWREVGDMTVVPLAEPALDEAGLTLVGRSEERAALVDAWSRARAGRAPLVLLTGPPGSGRTRLAWELARSVHEDGATVLYGRCTPAGAPPFQPFVEALAHHVAHLSDADLPAQLGPGAGELVRLVPELDGRVTARPSEGDPGDGTSARRLHDAVGGWLAASTRDEPALLVLDDLHHAGRSTLALLEHLVRRDHGRRVLLVATLDLDGDRTGNRHLDALLPRLRLAPRVLEELELPPLSAPEGERLLGQLDGLAEAAGRTVPDRDVRPRVLARAAGNPLFLVHGHRFVGADPAGAGALPSDLRSLLVARARRCGEDAFAVAQAASVIGRSFDVGVLQAVCERDPGEVAQALDVLARDGLLSGGERDAEHRWFSHPDLALALYGTLGVSWRARCHRRAGAEIELRSGPARSRHADTLAYHFVEAAADGDVEQGVTHAAAAGRAAAAKLAYEDATRWYRAAVRLLDVGVGDEPSSNDRLLRLLLDLGEAEARAAHPRAQATLTRAGQLARRRGDEDRLARAVLTQTADPLMGAGPPDAAWDALLDDAVRRTDLGPDLRAELLARTAWRDSDRDRVTADPEAPASPAAAGDPTVLAHAEDARRLAHQVGDPELLARVLQLWVPAVEGRSPDGDGEDAARQLHDVAVATHRPLWQGRAAVFVARDLIERGRADEAESWVATGREAAAELGSGPLDRALDDLTRSLAFLRGDLDRLDAHLRRSAPPGSRVGPVETSEPDGRRLVAEAMVHRLQGRNLELAPRLDEAASADPGAEGYALLRALADAGRQARAAVLYQQAADQGFPIHPVRMRPVALANLAYLTALYGDPDAALRLHRLLADTLDRFPRGSLPLHCGAHHQAMLAAVLGRTDESDRLFGMAERLHTEAGAPLLAAETRLEWARTLLAARRVEAARDLATSARDAAARHQAGGLLAQARSVIAHLDGESASVARPGRATIRMPPPG